MKVLALTYWSFGEALVQAGTLPYLRAMREAMGDGEILLLTLEKPEYALSDQKLLVVQEELAAEGIRLITLPYRRFGLRAMLHWAMHWIKLYVLCKREKVDVLHAFASPIGLVAERLSRWTGIPFVIDSYEPHAEAMVENGSWKVDSWSYRLLFRSEKRQSEKAKAVLATTAAMQSYAARTYGAAPRRLVERPACVNLDTFTPELTPHSDLNAWRNEGACIGIYAGKLGGIYLQKEVFDMMAVAQEILHDVLWVMLTDSPKEQVVVWAKEAGLSPDRLLVKRVAHTEVASYMAGAHFALNPVRPVPSKRYCTSIKDGEYWAMGLPVVLPAGISNDSDLVTKHKAGVVLETLDQAGYREGFLKLKALLSEDATSIQERIRALAQTERSMERARAAYRQVYGPNGWLRSEDQSFTAVIYNSLRDPLFQNLVLRYLTRQTEAHPERSFEVITYETSKYAVPESEMLQTRGALWAQGIHWQPLTYHSGRWMLLKKAWDFVAAAWLVVGHKRKNNTRGLIAFANTSAAITTVLARWTRLPMTIYSYEPHSKFLVETGMWAEGGLKFRMLNALEERASRRAKVVMTGTRHMVELLKDKTDALVLRAPSAVDKDVFKFRPEQRAAMREKLRLGERTVLIYGGKFGGLYYDKELFEGFVTLKAHFPDLFLLVLSPHDHSEIQQWAETAGIQAQDLYVTEATSALEMSAWYSAADLGISTIPPLPNQRFRSPVKVGEYLLCGLPYITCEGVSEDDEVARDHNVGVVLPAMNKEGFEGIIGGLSALLEEPVQRRRGRCREAGLAYRNIDTVHAAFETALERLLQN